MAKGTKRRNFWRWKEVEDDKNIVTLTDSKPNDLVIPLMGPTGVGKSTFLNAAAGGNFTTVGHDLSSCTAKVQAYAIPYPSKDDPNRRIIIVDTPGFDDTFVEDTEILRRISVWLARSYNDKQKLAGIIYLHDISQARMLGTMRKSLVMFRQLCGDDALKNVILGTTKWGDVKRDVGIKRGQQLAETHWKEVIDHGAEMAQFRNTQKSALAIIDLIVNRNQAKALLIQEEVVDLQLSLPETEAGKALRSTLDQLLQAQKNMAQRLPEDDERFQENQEQLRSTLKQIEELKIPFSRRLLNFFTGR